MEEILDREIENVKEDKIWNKVWGLGPHYGLCGKCLKEMFSKKYRPMIWRCQGCVKKWEANRKKRFEELNNDNGLKSDCEGS
ncbi:hypothetical protein UFOVP1357_11 [uncultured Caudovirales phage]|uniref:Uncharacterized protein n=1 Tax=uncultured Caudovirales phage TaxID=2100421 RepID=A0A6J5LGN7_9CAUD|nr:hypothetical protein UFOVP18_3 [uncultured Caudovirales phage]CAB4126589.1 hypothetical protein UFOVP82_5 [uncultured Caudovirales phage]CAB4132702.1 hypothetical protein UFOVP258_54 [uncultured Caudovirales phage]CAB4146602.1 hypothetical protein UFOVP502_46 [uncultured Caudovirales phage]CAB4199738.1 hypothetical protein UFOVP1357_11 [uncultured Caudovirales phage]